MHSGNNFLLIICYKGKTDKNYDKKGKYNKQRSSAKIKNFFFINQRGVCVKT